MAPKKTIDGKQVCLNLSKGLLKRLDERAKWEGLNRSRVAERLLNAQLQAETINVVEIQRALRERIEARKKEGGFSYQQSEPSKSTEP